MTNRFDIILAGIGVGGFDRTTPETLKSIKSARIIFHLTSYHKELKRRCQNVVDLRHDYWTGEEDIIVYKRMANIVLKEAKKGPNVLCVGDGHPSIYDDVSWDIYHRGKRRGLKVKIEPAISCLDAMAAFCGLDIRTLGLQILEATGIVQFHQKINPHMDLLIMQIGWFGTSLLYDIHHSRSCRFTQLINYLRKFYPMSHRIKIMQASDHKDGMPEVISTTLSSLNCHHKKICSATSLFIPAVDSLYMIPKDKIFKNKLSRIDHLKNIAVLEE